jgi:hypothetical protein
LLVEEYGEFAEGAVDLLGLGFAQSALLLELVYADGFDDSIKAASQQSILSIVVKLLQKHLFSFIYFRNFYLREMGCLRHTFLFLLKLLFLCK